MPIVDRVFAGAREQFAQQAANGIYAVGYCFGARYVLRLAASYDIKAGAIAHGIQTPGTATRWERANRTIDFP